MIYQRSRTIEVEHEGAAFVFKRPPGSVLLGWGAPIKEIAEATKEGGILELPPDDYTAILESLAEWIYQVNGDPMEGTTPETLDQELLPQDAITIWAGLYMRCQMPEDDKAK